MRRGWCDSHALACRGERRHGRRPGSESAAARCAERGRQHRRRPRRDGAIAAPAPAHHDLRARDQHRAARRGAGTDRRSAGSRRRGVDAHARRSDRPHAAAVSGGGRQTGLRHAAETAARDDDHVRHDRAILSQGSGQYPLGRVHERAVRVHGDAAAPVGAESRRGSLGRGADDDVPELRARPRLRVWRRNGIQHRRAKRVARPLPAPARPGVSQGHFRRHSTFLTVSERDLAVLRSFARRIDASDAGAHNNLGVLYYQKGLVPEAIQEFTRALELDPKMQVAQRNLEIAYHHTGFYDRRVAEFKERLRAAPDDRDARWELGRAYAILGQYDQAVEEFEALLGHAPKDVAAIIQLGLAEKNRGRPEVATEWFLRAQEIEPSSTVVQFYLGEIYYNRGLNDAALTALQRAVQLNPDNANAHYLMAFVLGDMGRHQDARGASKRAIALNPPLARAQTNLSLERYNAERKSQQQRLLEQPEP